jgi:hypothetical protein
VQVGVSITMSSPFRDSTQEWTNVFHYKDGTALLAPSEAMIDEIVGVLKALHSSLVTFVRAKVWSSGGTQAQNQMLFQKQLSGNGVAGSDSGMDKERAYLIRWPAGFDSRGKPVYLRKWFHTCGAFGATVAATSGVLANVTGMTAAQRTAIANAADVLKRVTSPLWILCAESGREAQNVAQAHKYLEHHQLGDMWR